MKAKQEAPNRTTIPIRFHPRVFESLGSGLVTNDSVAMIELVKNAYDAYASCVDIRFIQDPSTDEEIIEIQDDGAGMSLEVIRDAWCVVGTPYRTKATEAIRGNQRRRVTGEKGLGRLSAARLGNRLTVITKQQDTDCWEVSVDWTKLVKSKSLDECTVDVRSIPSPRRLGSSGTILQVSSLRRSWTESEIEDLQGELGRLVPPYKTKIGFQVTITPPGERARALVVQPSGLLAHPPYMLSGTVDEFGIAAVTYAYNSADRQRTCALFADLTSTPVRFEPEEPRQGIFPFAHTDCGPLSFELRAWDLDRDALFDLAGRLDLSAKANVIRSMITDSPFAGISLYRDGILVLPKTSASRDWLGLNLRRVSRVGTRLSANQIVGHVGIGADRNPLLLDTSERERLIDNNGYRQFRSFMEDMVALLETERERDRIPSKHAEPPLHDLFASLRSENLRPTVVAIKDKGGSFDEVLEVVDRHASTVEEAVDEIERRFYYYSRLASLGSLAAILQHEVSTHVVALDELLRYLGSVPLDELRSERISSRLDYAQQAIRALRRLSDMFSPLASRAFATRRRNCVVEKVIESCLGMRSADITKDCVQILVESSGMTEVRVDPGEMSAIILNLLDNALYWLTKSEQGSRAIRFVIDTGKQEGRVTITVHDSGAGIPDGDEERIFWPGVTRKPGGIGMGLTVASEIVAERDGKMHLVKPGLLGGASFGFDLPLAGR